MDATHHPEAQLVQAALLENTLQAMGPVPQFALPALPGKLQGQERPHVVPIQGVNFPLGQAPVTYVLLLRTAMNLHLHLALVAQLAATTPQAD
jgi:hypothetical protein